MTAITFFLCTEKRYVGVSASHCKATILYPLSYLTSPSPLLSYPPLSSPPLFISSPPPPPLLSSPPPPLPSPPLPSPSPSSSPPPLLSSPLLPYPLLPLFISSPPSPPLPSPPLSSPPLTLSSTCYPLLRLPEPQVPLWNSCGVMVPWVCPVLSQGKEDGVIIQPESLVLTVTVHDECCCCC